MGSAPLPVQPIDDALTELDETFSLTVTNAGPGVRLLPCRQEQTLATAPPAGSVALSGDVLATVDGADLKILRRSAGIWAEEATFPATPEGGVHSVALDQDWLAADFQQSGVNVPPLCQCLRDRLLESGRFAGDRNEPCHGPSRLGL